MDSWAEHGLKLFDNETRTFGLNLDRATALWRERDHQVTSSAVEVKPRPPSDGTLAFLALLAPQLQAKSKKNLHADSVRDAHDAAKEWLELSRASGADCSLPLANYGDVLRDSYVLHEREDDILMAIKLYEEALEGDRDLVLDHDSLLSELSTALWTLGRKGDHPDILEQRIKVLERLLVLRKDDAPKRRPVLQDLGWIYMTISDILQTREPSLLKAREMYEEALAIQPRDPVADADITSNIGIVLVRLGHQRGDIQLLLEAETMHRRVLLVPEQEETEDDQAVCNGFCPYCKTVNRVNNLGTALVHLHDIGGDERKLDEAIELFEAGIQEDLERHHKVTRNSIAMLSNYANALHNRYLTQNDVASLDEALRIRQQMLTYYPPDHVHHLFTLVALSGLHHDLFACRRRTADIDMALQLASEVLGSLPQQHDEYWNLVDLKALGEFNRYLVTGDLDSLRRARDQHLDAMANGAVADMKAHIPLAFMVVQAHPSVTVADLSEAIAMMKTALNATPVGHTAYSWILANLASSIGTLWETSQDPEDLLEATRLVQIHLDRLFEMQKDPDMAPLVIAINRCKLQGTLCRLLVLGHDLERAIGILLELVQSVDVTPRARLHDAANLLHQVERSIALQINTGEPSITMSTRKALGDIYREIVHMLPVVASLGLDHDVQLDELAVTETLGAHAAMHVSELGDVLEAVQLLEQARGVFWSQALRLRDPQIDLLPDHLANELRDLLQQLRTPEDSPLSKAYSLSYNSVTLRRVRQAERVRQIMLEARTMPGMNHIFRGPSPSDIYEAATLGHIVILVSTLSEVFAIVLPQGEKALKRVPFPQVTNDLIQHWIKDMEHMHNARGATRSDLTVSGDRAMRVTLSTRKATMDRSLREVWIRIIKPIIVALNLSRQSDRRRPRLHWCPTGELAFLPLHAAGIHDPRSSETLEACSDYFVSSYTPTLAALIDARRSAKPLPTGDIRALLVAEGRSPGFVPLEGVDDEIAMIQQVIQPACGRTVTLQGVEQRLATMELVLEEAQKANILHLACHGVQNVQKPLQSGFALKNGMLTLSSLLSLNLSGAFMAFLSACETAKGDRDQPNQIVHLAAAMLFAGFPNVVATMWTMGDADGPLVAETIYRYLMQRSTLSSDDVAYAVDEAVLKLRAEGLPASRWATFIHVGA